MSLSIQYESVLDMIGTPYGIAVSPWKDRHWRGCIVLNGASPWCYRTVVQDSGAVMRWPGVNVKKEG